MKKLLVPICVLIIAGMLLSLAGCAEIKNDPNKVVEPTLEPVVDLEESEEE